jgi:hypothetical protein
VIWMLGCQFTAKCDKRHGAEPVPLRRAALVRPRSGRVR